MYNYVLKIISKKYVDEYVYRFNLKKISDEENSDICYLIQVLGQSILN